MGVMGNKNISSTELTVLSRTNLPVISKLASEVDALDVKQKELKEVRNKSSYCAFVTTRNRRV